LNTYNFTFVHIFPSCVLSLFCSPLGRKREAADDHSSGAVRLVHLRCSSRARLCSMAVCMPLVALVAQSAWLELAVSTWGFRRGGDGGGASSGTQSKRPRGHGWRPLGCQRRCCNI